MTVQLILKDGVATVTINRPDRMNAVDQETAEQLESIWQKIEADTSVRCVVLTGAGERAFSAGADLKSESDASGLEYWASVNPNGFGGIASRQTLNVPIIGKINGFALGGGMEMVLGCDIVIATDDARFGLPEAKVGRLPMAGGMTMLQRMIPEKIAAGLMMTGRMMSASEAKHYGLVNAVVPRADLDAEVATWVKDIVSCAPLSLASIKRTIRDTAHLSIEAASSINLPSTLRALLSEDSEEGVTAFREKRAPVWRGK
ncbi:enoyl-CoA hydratase-related protein [Pseudovibrio sp. Tun.PSC04-5.I4]|uniref:enoyl-CoA hydratase-related protein n=1 Tax=Pseudovibrio sp. Tun.PSC04-5.I4 TaxID=1798213 RepID=UPI0008801681|nr:enoyl-CoA hydratase-related protein [Pseudovibrio sp. Tun.PSC04-5.I4]SDR00643.1 short chain enoyl-CoA hydratase [Pseudovibrio sp. Tun.PSC04-5.I4]